jgi:Iap family predicted aminopeptidase
MRASAEFKADEFFTQRVSEIKRAYVEAYRSGDNAALTEAREEWQLLPQARKGYGYSVQPLAEFLKVPAARAKREANTAGA